jgi:pre-mRNA-splicing factor ATP-dependent RNA helicase DHX15/PRP43
MYYDMASFPDGETKRALLRVMNKKMGKAGREREGDDRKKKKQKRA